MALAVWQLSPVNTDGDFQYIIALEIIVVCREDSKTPPGTLGCQLQSGAAAKVTGFLPYGQAGSTEQSCSADTCHTSGPNWPEHRLFHGAQKAPDEKRGECWLQPTYSPGFWKDNQSHSSYFWRLQGPSFLVQIKIHSKTVISFLIIEKIVFNIIRLGCSPLMCLTKHMSTFSDQQCLESPLKLSQENLNLIYLDSGLLTDPKDENC